MKTWSKWLTAALLLYGFCGSAEPVNLLDTHPYGLPRGWIAYGRGGSCRAESGVLRITNNDPACEWGICQTLPITKPGSYVFSLEVSVPEDARPGGNASLLLVCGNTKSDVVHFQSAVKGRYVRISARLNVFDVHAKGVTVYLYSSLRECSDFLIRNADFSPAGN